MKIAMVGLKGIPATYGGVERHVEELSARLARRGHDVTVYCREHYSSGMEEHRGVAIRILPSLNTKHWDTVTHTILSLADIAGRQEDILHFHSIGPASFSALARIVPKRMRIIATLHGLDWLRAKWNPTARTALRVAASAAVTFPHKTIVVSRAMQKYFSSRGKNVIYIPNGVEVPTPVEFGSLARLGIRRGEYLLWMGRFVPEKRVEDLLQAFALVKSDMRLLLAGVVDKQDEYLRRIRELAASDPRVIFAGGLFGSDRAEAITNAWAIALPSELEGFPIALLEGMRYGKPVIASDLPEMLEALRPAENGLAYPVRNVEALAAQLRWAIEHPNELEAMAAKAKLDAMQYDWDVITDMTEAVYRDACR